MNPQGGASAERGPAGLLTIGMDAVKLADLQIQLLTLDVKEFWGRAKVALGLVVVASILLLAALPVALIALADLLQDLAHLTPTAALFVVSGVAIVLATVGVVWSGYQLSGAAAPLKRSTDELRENLAWIRNVLHSDNGNGGEAQAKS